MKDIRVDGIEKVTGRAKYAGDLRFDSMIYGKVKRSPHPYARIKKINTEKIKNLKDVVVLTSSDIPGSKKTGVVTKDHYPLADDKALYYGDAVALVAAPDPEKAKEAIDLIEVDYEVLDGVFTIEEALKEDAPVLKEGFDNNIVTHYPLRKGNPQEEFKNCDNVIEREYKTQFVEHAYIETEAVVALPDEKFNSYKIYGSIQNPYSTRRSVAQIMGVPLVNVRIIQSHLGGSFGGKDDSMSILSCRAALLAKYTGKPVKIVYSREESIIDSYKRHPYICKYKVGYNNDGKLKAMKVEIYADAGANISMTPFVTWRSVVQATGPYELEHAHTDIYGVATNNPYTGAFRGFGSPQIVFAQESLMDEIAHSLDMDGVELRKLNGYKQGSITASGQKLLNHKVSLEQVIDEVVKSSDYFNRKKEFKDYNKRNDRYKKGIGLSSSFRGCSLGAEGTDSTGAYICVHPDGSVNLLAGLAENGQGLKTTFCKIAASEFGIELDKFMYLDQDTGYMVDGGPTVASRSTLTGGSAVKNAAEIIKNRIAEAVYKELEASSAEEIVFENNQVKGSSKTVSFEKAVAISCTKGVNLSAVGWFNAPDVSWDEEKGQGPAYFTYVYGGEVAEITVDTYTGKIFVDNVHAAHDVGRVINEKGAAGQVYGGVVQGIGYSIFEEVDVQNGIIKNTNLDEYFVPTVKDFGKITPILIENPDKYGPEGAKSLGEPVLELISAAINNAVFNAINKRFYKIPLDLETIVVGKQLKRKSKRGSEK
ncbi:MAG: xanthine dehydrogenase family protein molybdopterin-binding subunit [Candidatus Muiribacteriota bacterium]